VDTLKLASDYNEDHQKIIGAVKSLEALEMVISEGVKSTRWELTEEGLLVAEKGSHEAVLYHSVPEAGIAQAELVKVSKKYFYIWMLKSAKNKTFKPS
jgi:phenylalanyl-tRNA synthetase alpha chain